MEKHINLQLGWPSPSLFPAAQILDGANTVLNSPSKVAAALIYGPDAGHQPLREEIAKWLNSIYRPNQTITPERLCVSNGASGNLDNILAKFTEPGYTRRIWMVEPSYFLACPIFTDNGFEGRLSGVPEDAEGIDIAFLRSALQRIEAEGQHPDSPSIKTGPLYGKLYKHIVYAVPTFSNPSAKTMSLRRREDLVRLAREFDALIVTDDVYDVLRWDQHGGSSGGDDKSLAAELGPVPPRIVDVDRELDGGPRHEWGNAVSNGSFAKIIGPGVRTGWAEAAPAFTLRLSQLGATRSGGCPSHLTATFVHDMLASGSLQKHIGQTLIPTYRARYHVMMTTINEYLVPLGFRVSTGKPYGEGCISSNGQINGHSTSLAVVGGFFVYLETPSKLRIPVKELAAVALEKHNLKFAYGDMMTVLGDEGSAERAKTGFGNAVRLCWAWHTEDEIREGVQRLADVTKEFM